MKNKSIWILVVLLFCIVAVSFFFITHLAEVNSFVANYYFKKNNIVQAQNFYERAFKLGLSNSKQRDIYVNTIINSPFDIQNQEKLKEFLDYPIEDFARTKAECFLADLKREIHRKYPQNYVIKTVYNQKVLRWGEKPITYAFKYDKSVPKYYIKEFENALTEWERATDYQIIFSENFENPNILISFDVYNPAKASDSKYVVAYTTPIVEIDKLKRMDIVFYLKNPYGKFFSKNKIYNTALHEISHALGFMGHSDDRDDVMYLAKDSYVAGIEKREVLTEADINTIKLLYKIKPDITNIEDKNSLYIPSLILGGKDDINSEKVRDAKLYIAKAPKIVAGYVDLAEAYIAEKDYTNAIKNLEKAATLATTDDIKAMIYYNLAVTYFYSDYFEKARDYLKLSANIQDNDEKKYLLAEIYIREGQTEKAIVEYEKLLLKNPQNIEYVIALTNIHVLNKDYYKARKVLKTFFENCPEEKNNPRFNPYGMLKLFL